MDHGCERELFRRACCFHIKRDASPSSLAVPCPLYEDGDSADGLKRIKLKAMFHPGSISRE